MSAFSLMPYENQLPGVRYRNGILRLRATWAATGAGLFGAVIGVGGVAIGIAVHRVLRVIFVLPLIAGPVVLFMSVRYLRCRVVCEERTVRVVNKRRSFTFDLDEIRETLMAHFEPEWFWPLRSPGTIWPQTLAGVWLITSDGSRVLCDALVGLPGGGPSVKAGPIETKAFILQRWIEGASATPPTG